MLKPIKVKQKVTSTAAQIQLNCSGMTMDIFCHLDCQSRDKVRRFFPGTPSSLSFIESRLISLKFLPRASADGCVSEGRVFLESDPFHLSSNRHRNASHWESGKTILDESKREGTTFYCSLLFSS